MSDTLNAPTLDDLDERIDINLKEGLTLEYLVIDTKELIKEFEWTAARCMVQARIYKDLLERTEQRLAKTKEV